MPIFPSIGHGVARSGRRLERWLIFAALVWIVVLATSEILNGLALIYQLPSTAEYLHVPLPTAVTQREGKQALLLLNNLNYCTNTTCVNSNKNQPLPKKILSTEKQLGHALQAFGYAHSLAPEWADRYHNYLIEAGIDSMHDLATGSKERTVNLDLDFIGCPVKDRLDNRTLHLLYNFLPGPLGHRCFRLSQMAADRVEKGLADVKYVHRPESGLRGNESWQVHGKEWTLHVDCAGFVRSVLKHVTKDLFQPSLSDRSFMRAKDFYRFFETIQYMVTDAQDLPEETDKLMKWRIVPDLRMVIPGDIIVYRQKGNSAGGAAFTDNDRSDLKHLFKAVKMAQLWRNETKESSTGLVTRNVGRDPSIKGFVEDYMKRMNGIGIHTCTNLRASKEKINELLEAKGLSPINEDTLQLMKECSLTTAANTGHIVFVAGPTESRGDNEYRIPVVHSTSSGKPDENGNPTEGVQEYFREFTLVEGADGVKWTRAMNKVAALPENVIKMDDKGDINDNKDVEYGDPEDEDDGPGNEGNVPESAADELYGLADVEVLAARMCF